MLTLQTADPNDTRRLAGVLASWLRPGDVVSLTGELGAGKTCFVQGAAAALGVVGHVTSPTFVLRHDYVGRVPDDPSTSLPILHLDVYRLDRLSEVADLGYDEVSDGAHLVFVEWGDALGDLLPSDYLEVELRLAPPDPHARAAPAGAPVDDAVLAETRLLQLRAHGGGWAERMAALGGQLDRWVPR